MNPIEPVFHKNEATLARERMKKPDPPQQGKIEAALTKLKNLFFSNNRTNNINQQ